jgi:hypothetical protein
LLRLDALSPGEGCVKTHRQLARDNFDVEFFHHREMEFEEHGHRRSMVGS